MSGLFDDDVDDEDDEFIAEDSAPEGPALELIGYNAVEAQIVQAFNAGRLPHALIFAGDAGRGKESMAYRMARALLSTQKPRPFEGLDVAPNDPIIHRLAIGAHPDFQRVERTNKKTKNELSEEIVVDDVRHAIGFLALKPVESDWRVVIVDEAHLMNIAAQNAFLKTMEEPPPHTLLMLIAHQPARLLPTIRSRGQIFNFPALPPQVLLQEGGSSMRALPKDVQDALLRMARGGIGSLKRLTDPAVSGGVEKIRGLLNPQTEIKDIYGFAERWPNEQTGALDSMELLENTLLDHVSAKLHEDLGDEDVKDDCLAKIDELTDLFQSMRRKYLDKRQVVRQAFACARG